MKKLMMVVFAVSLMTVANGASMKWGTGKMQKPDTTETENPIPFATAYVRTTATAYLFELSSAQYMNLLLDASGQSVSSQSAADFEKTAANVFSTYASVNEKTGAITVNGATASGTTGNTSSKKEFTDSAGDTYGVDDTAYAAMIITTTATVGSETKYYYIANIGEYTFEADETGNLAAFGTSQWGDAANTALEGWTMTEVNPEPEPIPEPTSAMLLMLGVCGLALRRKQK